MEINFWSINPINKKIVINNLHLLMADINILFSGQPELPVGLLMVTFIKWFKGNNLCFQFYGFCWSEFQFIFVNLLLWMSI